MNCLTCQQKIEEFQSGTLPDDLKKSIRIHLDECEDCKLAYAALVLTEKVITDEKIIDVNPFLATRVMAEIEQSGMDDAEYSVWTVFKRSFQPALGIATIVIALFLGVVIGNNFSSAYSKNTVPEEAIFMNDAAIESIGLLTE